MKKSLLWLLIMILTVSMIATFSLAGCKKAEEAAEEAPAEEAAAVFNLCSNVYGDTSWVPGYNIQNWIKKYGKRFMLGSDHADNLLTELTKIRTIGLTEDEQESILEKTSFDVFNIKKHLAETIGKL